MDKPHNTDKIAHVVRIIVEYWRHILLSIIGSAGLILTEIILGSDELWHGYKLRQWGYVTLILFSVALIWLTINIALKERSTTERLETANQRLATKSERIGELENENDQLRATFGELVNDQLSLIFHRLGLKQNERISVYKHDAGSSRFVLLGRYAPNPEHKKQRRKTYPDNEGFIMKAWREGEFSVEDLPDPEARKGKTYYDRVNQLSPIQQQVLESIRMKSRCFYCKAICSPDTITHVAVVIVESLDAFGLDTNNLRNWFGDGGERSLYLFVQHLKINFIQVDGQLARSAGL